MFRGSMCLAAAGCVVAILFSPAFGQESDESLLEKALDPTAKEKAPMIVEDEAAPPLETTPLQKTPSSAEPAPAPVSPPTEAAVTPALQPRAMFLPSAAVGVDPFGGPFVAGANVRCGESVLLRGTQLGTPVGRVVLQVDRLIFDASVVEWGANGIHVEMPKLRMLGPTEAMIHVIRGDGVVCDRMPVDLFPSEQ